MAVSCVIPPLRLAARLKRYIHANKTPPIAQLVLPRTLIIVPIKGIAEEMHNLEDNLKAVLEQHLPDYRVIFAVGDSADMALPILRKLESEYTYSSVVIAQHGIGQSQKISNQLRALEEITDKDEVLVFCDCDARPDMTHFAKLIAPLVDPSIGATTGFRWYIPTAKGLGTWLRAAWNLGGMPFLIDRKYNYAWGGAMAIRRNVFEKCEITRYWSSALSDDLGLSLVVKQAGYQIHFVPECLVPSPENLTLLQTIEWTTRQTLVCRVYNPIMWRDLFLGEFVTSATILIGFTSIIYGILTDDLPMLIAGLLAGMVCILGRSVYQLIILRTAQSINPKIATHSRNFILILLAPLVNPLMLYNSVRSWMSRRMDWRGIRYVLRGPLDISVIKD